MISVSFSPNGEEKPLPTTPEVYQLLCVIKCHNISPCSRVLLLAIDGIAPKQSSPPLHIQAYGHIQQQTLVIHNFRGNVVKVLLGFKIHPQLD